MKRSGSIAKSLALFAWLGLATGPSAVAAPNDSDGAANRPSATRQIAPEILDIVLGPDGTFTGQVVDASGTGRPAAEIALHSSERLEAVVHTDENGRFRFSGLCGGLYRLVTGRTERLVRLWAESTAPASARPTALVVDASDVIRGQLFGQLAGFASPIAVVGAAAVAVGASGAFNSGGGPLPSLDFRPAS